MFNRDSHGLYVCRFVDVCLWETHTNICMPKCVGGITWSKQAYAQSQFWEFETKCHLILPSSGQLMIPDTRIIHFYMLEQLNMDEKEAEKNIHLEMRNLKQTELQRLMNRGKKG